MAVHKPGSRLLHDVPLKFVRDRVSGHHGGSVYASLNLTSMIDFLVIIVVFLLGTFAASGEYLTIQKDLELPKASTTVALERAPIIAVSWQADPKDGTVTLDGQYITTVSALLKEDANTGTGVTELTDKLTQIKDTWALIHRSEPFPGTVVMQVDKGVDFKAVKRLVVSAGQAGFFNLNLAVTVGGQG